MAQEDAEARQSLFKDAALVRAKRADQPSALWGSEDPLEKLPGETAVRGRLSSKRCFVLHLIQKTVMQVLTESDRATWKCLRRVARGDRRWPHACPLGPEALPSLRLVSCFPEVVFNNVPELASDSVSFSFPQMAAILFDSKQCPSREARSIPCPQLPQIPSPGTCMGLMGASQSGLLSRGRIGAGVSGQHTVE